MVRYFQESVKKRVRQGNIDIVIKITGNKFYYLQGNILEARHISEHS